MPALACDPSAISKNSHQYFNASCFRLPTTLGQNGVYRTPRLTGPSLTSTDVTLAKTTHVTEKSTVQLRIAAFNFLNHANTTFDQSDSEAYTLNFNTTSTTQNLPGALSQARSQNAGFGFAPLRSGRRILELALRYDF